MRVLLDTNILISYLLTSEKDTIIPTVVRKIITKRHTLLLPIDLLHELVAKVPEKPYLRDRITQQELLQFLDLLKTVGEVIPVVDKPIPQVLRDAKDDYLLFYALLSDADYLVTGDKDLLSLKQVKELQTISPKEFLKLL